MEGESYFEFRSRKFLVGTFHTNSIIKVMKHGSIFSFDVVLPRAFCIEHIKFYNCSHNFRIQLLPNNYSVSLYSDCHSQWKRFVLRHWKRLDFYSYLFTSLLRSFCVSQDPYTRHWDGNGKFPISRAMNCMMALTTEFSIGFRRWGAQGIEVRAVLTFLPLSSLQGMQNVCFQSCIPLFLALTIVQKYYTIPAAAERREIITVLWSASGTILKREELKAVSGNLGGFRRNKGCCLADTSRHLGEICTGRGALTRSWKL